MLGLDVRASILAGLVSCKENNPSRLLRVAFKHRSPHAPKVVCLFYRMLGPRSADQPSQTCPILRPAAHALTPALDRRIQPAANCGSPGWKSNGRTDGGARSTQKRRRRSVHPDLRSARPPKAAWADSRANARSPLAVVHHRKVLPPAALRGQPAPPHPTSPSPHSALAPAPALESTRASPRSPQP